MKALITLLLALPLLLAGCESGSPGGAENATDGSASAGTATTTETTYVSTRTTSPDDPAPTGGPYEGDTKIENYTVADTEENVIESGTRTYTYTEGVWVLASDVGAE